MNDKLVGCYNVGERSIPIEAMQHVLPLLHSMLSPGTEKWNTYNHTTHRTSISLRVPKEHQCLISDMQ
jgi:hypothetical protein